MQDEPYNYENDYQIDDNSIIKENINYFDYPIYDIKIVKEFLKFKFLKENKK